MIIMKNRKGIIAIALAGLWITISEFVRNELLFKNYWTDHYYGMGLTFQTNPVNGIFWTIWSLLFASILFQLLKKFSFKQTLLLGWLFGFVMMWVTLYNLQVLPFRLLIFAVPLSLIEVMVAGIIIKAVLKDKKV